MSMGVHATHPKGLVHVLHRYSGFTETPRSFAALQTEILYAKNHDQSGGTPNIGHDDYVAATEGPTHADLVGGPFGLSGSRGVMVATSVAALLAPAPSASVAAEDVKKLALPGSHTGANEHDKLPGADQAAALVQSDTASVRGATSPSQHAFVYGGMIHGTHAGQETGLGSNANLDEEGYSEVLSMKNNREMEIFLRRAVEDLGLVIVNQQGLQTVVNSSSFGHFKGKVLNLLGEPHAWVIDPGRPLPAPLKGTDAPLTEEGYVAIANLDSNFEMIAFIDRAVAGMGLQVVNHGGVEGLAPFFSGDKRVQNFAALTSEIQRAAKTNGSWAVR